MTEAFHAANDEAGLQPFRAHEVYSHALCLGLPEGLFGALQLLVISVTNRANEDVENPDGKDQER